MCQSQSVGSYKQASEVSRMELQKGREELYTISEIHSCVHDSMSDHILEV